MKGFLGVWTIAQVGVYIQIDSDRAFFQAW